MEQTIKIKKQSIVKRFLVIFTLMTVAILLTSLLFTYNYQIHSYKEVVRKNLYYICTQMYDEIKNDEENFYAFQNYMLNTDRDKFDLPLDFSDHNKAKAEFDKAFAIRYPGLVYGVDICFDEMDEDLKDLFCVYYQEYWILRFEYYRSLYNSPYTYYMLPDRDGYIYYIIDVERAENERGSMNLWDYYKEDVSEMPILFDTWSSGENLDLIEEFHNEWGNTYSYYLLLYINGEKMGVIAADMDVDSVNMDVLKNTLILMLIVSLVIVAGMIVLIWYINKKYIKRLAQLNMDIEEYSRDRNVNIVDRMKAAIKENDEISSLSWRIISMINQIHCHLTDMLMVSENLNNTNEKIQRLTELSEQDGLTRLGNKLAYTKHEQALNAKIRNGSAKFAVIMLDLNYLKRINDTYGHEKGDALLKKMSDYLKTVFGDDKDSKCYRIGGDEFAVIVENYEDSQILDGLITELKHYMNTEESDNAWERVSAAIGSSEYVSSDESFADVFKRADELMYQNKKQMKAERID